MTVWTSDELTTIGAADELELASLRRDGTLRKPVTIWVVRYGDDLYVRAYMASIWSAIPGSASSTKVTSLSTPPARMWPSWRICVPRNQAASEPMYHTKYRRYDARYVDPMVAPAARAATIKLVPRATT